jgi:hypothetical protein
MEGTLLRDHRSGTRVHSRKHRLVGAGEQEVPARFVCRDLSHPLFRTCETFNGLKSQAVFVGCSRENIKSFFAHLITSRERVYGFRVSETVFKSTLCDPQPDICKAEGPHSLVHVQVASKEQGQNNQQEQAYADRVIVPVLTVWPNWKAPHNRYDNNYRENKQ